MKDILCSQIRTDIVKMSTLPNTIYRFSAISIKTPMAFFTEVEQTILQFVWNHKKPGIVQTILRRKNKAGGTMLPMSNYINKAIVIKIV